MRFLSRWWPRKPAHDAEKVYVSEKFGVRSLHIGSDTVQSAMRLARPIDLELSYTRSMMGFLLFNDRPAFVLIIGLGGGSLAKFIYHRLPSTVIEVVEVNPGVLAIARQYFHVPQDDARFAVVVGDGAEYMTRQGRSASVILVDGYDGESQVEALSTREFYDACRRRLETGGVLVVNLWGSDRHFDENLRRIEAAFPAGTACLPAEKPGNVIVFAFASDPGDLLWRDLERRAEHLEGIYRLEFTRFVRSLRKMNRCDAERLYVRTLPLSFLPEL